MLVKDEGQYLQVKSGMMIMLLVGGYTAGVTGGVMTFSTDTLLFILTMTTGHAD